MPRRKTAHVRRRRNRGDIPQAKVEMFAKVKALWERPGTRGEEKSAGKKLEALRSKYPGIEELADALKHASRRAKARSRAERAEARPKPKTRRKKTAPPSPAVVADIAVKTIKGVQRHVIEINVFGGFKQKIGGYASRRAATIDAKVVTLAVAKAVKAKTGYAMPSGVGTARDRTKPDQRHRVSRPPKYERVGRDTGYLSEVQSAEVYPQEPVRRNQSWVFDRAGSRKNSKKRRPVARRRNILMETHGHVARKNGKRLSKDDVADFRRFCRQATDSQLFNIYEKERRANRRTYARVAKEELQSRGLI